MPVPIKLRPKLTYKQKLRQPHYFMFAIGLALMLLQLYLAHRQRAYTSDDVSLQAALQVWNPFGRGDYHAGTDPFILKVPFYWLLGFVASPSRTTLFWTSAIFATANFSLYYWAFLYFLRRWRISLSIFNLLPIVWLGSLGLPFANLFLNPNLRNVELGAMFVYFMYIAKLYSNEVKPLRSRNSLIKHGLLWVLVGLFMLNDLYFFYFGVVPSVVFATFWFLKEPRSRKAALIIAGGTGVAVISFGFFYLLARAGGFSFINSAPATIVNFENLFGNIAATLHSLFVVFDADFWGHTMASATGVALLLHALVLLSVVLSVKKIRASKAIPDRQWFLFFACLCGLAIIYYTFSQLSEGIYTYRYLVIVPMCSAVLLTIYMSQSRPVQRLVLSSVIALGLLISVPVSIAHAYKSVAKPADQQPNYRETILYQNLREQGFKVGYAPYWEAVISTYLADHSVNTVPVTCRTGKLQKYRWLVTDYDLEQTHEKTFLVFDPNFVNTGEMCNEATLTEQFGKPRDVQIIAGWQVNMYDHDILLNN